MAMPWIGRDKLLQDDRIIDHTGLFLCGYHIAFFSFLPCRMTRRKEDSFEKSFTPALHRRDSLAVPAPVSRANRPPHKED